MWQMPVICGGKSPPPKLGAMLVGRLAYTLARGSEAA